MEVNKVPLYSLIVNLVLIIILEIVNPTFVNIRNSYSKLTDVTTDMNTFDLNIAVYVLLIPLIMNTVIICVLGKYTHESARSMVKCYIASIYVSFMSFLFNITLSLVINLCTNPSFFLCNCAQLLSTLSLVVFNTFNILSVEIKELKYINNAKRVELNLMRANKKPCYLLALYFMLYFVFFVYLISRIVKVFSGLTVFFMTVISLILSFVVSYCNVMWYRKRTKM